MPTRFAAPCHRTFSDEPALAAFAADFATQLRVGDTVALGGPLGAGKTTFVRAIVRALHGTDQTTSPTFTFWHHYPGSPPIEHLDLYRVDHGAELAELGLEEAFIGGSIVLVEWWANAPALLPRRRFEIELDGSGDAPRTLLLRSRR